MRRSTYKKIVCNCGTCKKCRAQRRMRNVTKRSNRQSFDQLYDESLLSDHISLLDDSFLSLVDEESDSDSADDTSLGPLLGYLVRNFPYIRMQLKMGSDVARGFKAIYDENRKNDMSRRAAVRDAAAKLGLISNSQSDGFSDSFNDLSDTLYGLLNEEDSLIQEFKKYKLDGSLQSVLPRTSVENAPDDVRKAITSGESRAGIYVFFKNGKHVYVGESQNLPRRLSQHRLCFRKFKINSSPYKVEVYLFKNRSKKPLKEFLKDIEREYRYKYLEELGHQKDTFENDFGHGSKTADFG